MWTKVVWWVNGLLLVGLLAAVSYAWVERERAALLQEQVVILKATMDIQTSWAQGLNRVNAACGRLVVTLTDRLGLPGHDDYQALMTTAVMVRDDVLGHGGIR